MHHCQVKSIKERPPNLRPGATTTTTKYCLLAGTVIIKREQKEGTAKSKINVCWFFVDERHEFQYGRYGSYRKPLGKANLKQCGLACYESIIKDSPTPQFVIYGPSMFTSFTVLNRGIMEGIQASCNRRINLDVELDVSQFEFHNAEHRTRIELILLDNPNITKLIFDNANIYSEEFLEESLGINLGLNGPRAPGTVVKSRLSFLTKAKKLQELKMSKCHLKTVPEEIFEMSSQLRILDLSKNEIFGTPPAFAQLHSLEILDLSYNKLRPDNLFLPPKLRELFLVNCGLFGKGFFESDLTGPELRQLAPTLITLFISENALDNECLPFLAELTGLRKLYLRNNRLTQFPYVANYRALYELDVSQNDIELIGDNYLGSMNTLAFFNCAQNKRLVYIPDIIGECTNLVKLVLSNCALTSLPYTMGSLARLQALHLEGNQLDGLPISLGQLLELKVLELKDNPLQEIPEDILSKPTDQILAFLAELGKSGSRTKWRTIKLVLVGREGAGKTSLLRCLTDGSRAQKAKGKGLKDKTKAVEQIRKSSSAADESPSTVSTDGIDISLWEPDDAEGIRFSTWDFGGQEVFYPTHQFFMTSRSLYLIVFKLTDDEIPRVEYWLRQVKSRAERTQALIIGTHLDAKGMTQERVNGYAEICEMLKRRYSFVKDYFFISTATMHGVSDVRESLITCAKDHTLLKALVPTNWVYLEKRVRQKLQQGVRHMAYEDFSKIAEAEKVSAEGLPLAMQFLHDIGTITWFADSKASLKSLVVLDSQWLANVMSSLVSFTHSWIRNGILQKSSLPHIWHNKFDPSMYDPLTELLQKFDIAFTLKGGQSMMIPSLLSEQPPEPSLLEREWPSTDIPVDIVSHYRLYKFDFLPLGFFARVLVRMYHLPNVEMTTYWRDGLIIRRGASSALLRYDYKEHALHVTVRSQAEIDPKMRQVLLKLDRQLVRQSSNRAIQAALQKAWSRCKADMLVELMEAIETLLEGYYAGYLSTMKRLIPCNHCTITGTHLQLEQPADQYVFHFNDVVMAVKTGNFVHCRSGKDTQVLISFLAPDLGFSSVPIISNLTIGQKLAEGGFGIVFKGKMGGTEVAVKELKTDASASQEDQLESFNEFQREVYIMCSLEHPNIVRLFGVTLNPLRMVMEFVGGGDLYRLVHKQRDEIPMSTRLKIGYDITAGMRYLASITPPIVHRDLRSPNVFLSKDSAGTYSAKVADFGLSRRVAPNLAGWLQTWQWLAPEVIDANSIEYDEKSDVYSFGMVMYEIFERKVPYDDEQPNYTKGGQFNLHGMKEAIINGGVRPRLVKTPGEIQNILQGCWVRDPGNRPNFDTLTRQFADLAKVRLVEPQTPKEKADVPFTLLTKLPHTAPVLSVCFEPATNSLWTGDGKGVLSVYDLTSFARKQQVQAHAAAINFIALVGNVMWTASEGGVIRYWDTRTLDCLAEVVAHTGSTTAILVLPALETCVWTADSDGLVLQWTALEEGAPLQPQRVTTLSTGVNQLLWQEAHGIVWAVIPGGLVAIHISTLAVENPLELGLAKILPTSRAVVLGDELWVTLDRQIGVWNVTNSRSQTRALIAPSPMSLVLAGDHVWSGGGDAVLRAWSTEAWHEAMKIEKLHSMQIPVLAYLPFGVHGSTEHGLLVSAGPGTAGGTVVIHSVVAKVSGPERLPPGVTRPASPSSPSMRPDLTESEDF